MPSKLEDLWVGEVSFVDRAANRRQFLVLKSHGGSQVDPENTGAMLKVALDTKAENEATVSQVLQSHGLEDEAAAAITAAVRILSAYSDAIPEEALNALAPSFGVTAMKAGDPNDDKPDLSDLPPDLRKKIEAVWQSREDEKSRADAIEARLQKMEEKEEAETFVRKARDDFGNLPTDPTKLGPVLKAASAALSEEQYQEITEVLRAADEMIAQSSIFDEHGKTTRKPSNTEDEVMAKARKLMADEPDLKQHEAISRVMKDPALARQYEQER
jgi:hypothetical protein